MKQKSKPASRQLRLLIDSEVVRQIRQHGRSSTKAEVCGVLIGHDRAGVVEVEACITGLNAEEAGAQVTFTQDTWEHIYKIKDKEYPEHRIVGWYHTHPGFGVFLSDHDTFIHNNFFSSPGQVAWVFDPHSDEEGCFGWVDGSIERLSQIAIVDGRGGEPARHRPHSHPRLATRRTTQTQNRRARSGRSCPAVRRRATVKLTYPKLAAAPELGALAILDAALSVAILALAAAWPELHTDRLPRDEPRAALDVIEHARDLGLAVRRYRRALAAAAARRDDEMPF